MGSDGCWSSFKVKAAACDDLVDLVEADKVPVDQRLVDQGPETLRRLQLR